VTDAFYAPDRERIVPGELRRGPWDPNSQHAGPASALLAVHLLRPPVGEWVCLDSVTHVDGLAMTYTALWDVDGRIGRAPQALLVRARA
jgi:hypothetical protein